MFVSIKTVVFFALIQIFLPSLIHADLIDDVCKKSSSYDRCVPVLRTQGNTNPDLTKLGQIALSATSGATRDAISLFNTILNKKKDGQQVIDAIVDCKGYYIAISNIIDHYKGSLKAKDYANMVKYATMIRSHVQSCSAITEHLFYDDYRNVMGASTNEDDSASILQAIGSMFQNSKKTNS
ncbi:hypothetical protein LIER_40285 [Lithospermum erythrorhizon]|uniref:Pectinesterase inhibitor domain-containing protein n=1 Tax=Lithospermum erythrorhizon TaxID=34254 RepID=A0AAV3QVD7_LITER